MLDEPLTKQEWETTPEPVRSALADFFFRVNCPEAYAAKREAERVEMRERVILERLKREARVMGYQENRRGKQEEVRL